jgi:hypothetical protein
MTFDLSVPFSTRRHFLKCQHLNIETKSTGYCVIDYYCADCGEWLYDKDFS